MNKATWLQILNILIYNLQADYAACLSLVDENVFRNMSFICILVSFFNFLSFKNFTYEKVDLVSVCSLDWYNETELLANQIS